MKAKKKKNLKKKPNKSTRKKFRETLFVDDEKKQH